LFHISEILDGFSEDCSVKYGVGLPEIMQRFAYDEMRFKRREPVRMVFPTARGSLGLFAASVFGRLPARVKPNFDSAFAEVCEVRYERATFQNFESFLESGNLFPRRITALHIEATPRASRFIDNCLFFFDAENPLDIIDYWNLRALGLTVIGGSSTGR
jgi:hypothetical protein